MSTTDDHKPSLVLEQLHRRGIELLTQTISEPAVTLQTFETIEGFTDELVRHVALHPETAIDWATNAQIDEQEYLTDHCFNVALMAIVYGIEAGHSDERLLNFALTAFLHDIGMSDLSYHLIYRTETFSPEQRQEMQQHPYLTLRRLQHLDLLSADVVFGIQDEHECNDGQGYPEQKSAETIHQFAKALKMLDVYEALMHVRPYRSEPMLPQKAMRHLLRMAKEGKIDPQATKIWLNRLSFFPIGSYVRLNNGARAKVVSVHRDNPLQPVLVTFRGVNESAPEHVRVLDLSMNQHLHIAETLTLPATEDDADGDLLILAEQDMGSVEEIEQGS